MCQMKEISSLAGCIVSSMYKCLLLNLCVILTVMVAIAHGGAYNETMEATTVATTAGKTTATASNGTSASAGQNNTGASAGQNNTGASAGQNNTGVQPNAAKSSGLVSVLQGKLTKEMFRSGTITNPKTYKYILAVKKFLSGLNCTRKCSMFSLGFEDDLEKVIDLLTNLPEMNGIKVDNTVDNLKEVLAALRMFVSPTFFNTASMRALTRRKDTADVQIKPMDLIADSLVPTGALKSASGDYADGSPTADINFEAKSHVAGTPEEKLDHFREDHQLHGFHWLFHNVQPEFKPMTRHRERFAYMHKNLLARYAIERHLAGLPPLKALDHNERLSQFSAFYPNRDFKRASPTKAVCQISAESEKELQDGWARTLQEIDSSEEQFDKVAEIVYHNIGHAKLSRECAEESRDGFLGDSEYSARDPMFYRWHTDVENLMQQYKEKHPYTADALKPAAVTVSSIELKSRCSTPNMVETFWDSRKFPVRFNDTDTIVSEKILNHEDFELTIKLGNPSKKTGKVILRMFMGLDEFISEAKWMVEMDRWVYTLKGTDEETLTRKSTENFLTDKIQLNEWNRSESIKEPCAWPRNLYLPKGKEGDLAQMRFVVFVHDVPEAVNEGLDPQKPGMYCGSRDGSVTFDERPFGFPLDRSWSGMDKQEVLNNKNQAFGNISVTVNIKFSKSKEATCTAEAAPAVPSAPPVPAYTSGQSVSGASYGSTCPPGFYKIRDTCYLVYLEAVPYDTAVRRCGEQNGRLTEYTEEKADAIRSIEEVVASQWTDPPGAIIRFWTAGAPDEDRKCNQFGSRGLEKVDCSLDKGSLPYMPDKTYVSLPLCSA